MSNRPILVLLCSFTLTACLSGSGDEGPSCGDLVCEGDESAATCRVDCVPCGDGVCAAGESSSCAEDCPAPDPDTGVLRIENHSSFVIVELNVSPCSAPTWGRNWLPEPLASGFYVWFTVEVGCWEMRAVAAGGVGEVSSDQVSVTRGSTYTWQLFNAGDALAAAPAQ
jgi:hypothetical protein